MNGASTRRWHRLGRALIVLAGSLFGLVLVVLILFILPPVRDRLLGIVLERSRSALPGELEIESARWPRPGRLELRELLWTNEGDTLADLDHVLLEVDLGALIRKDVIAHSIDASGRLVDVAAMQSAFESDDPDTILVPPDTTAAGFPRPGSLPGIPSIEIGQAHLEVSRVAISDSVAIEGAMLAGGMVALQGASPEVRVDALRGRMGDVRIDSLRVLVEYDSARATGRGAGWVGDDVPVSFRMVPTRAGAFHLDLEVGRSDPPVDGESAEIHLTGTMERREAGGILTRFEGRLHTPSSRVWRGWFSDSVSTEEREIPAIALRVDGAFQLPAPLAGNLHLELEPGEWVDSGTIRARLDENQLTLESMRLQLADLTVEGNGLHTPGRDEVQIEARARGGEFLSRIDPSWSAPESLSAEVFAAGARVEGRWQATAMLEGEAVLEGLGRSSIALQAQADSSAAQARILAGARELLAETTALVDLAAMNRVAETGTASALVPIRLDPIAVSLLGSRVPEATDVPLRNLQQDAARITISRDGNSFHVQGLRINGALGDIAADGRLARGASGPFTLRAEWNRFPEALQLALTLTPGELDSLRASWRDDAPYSVRASGQVDLAAALSTLRFGADVRLPGPRALAPLLDQIPPARLASMEPLTGRIQAVALGGNRRGTRARLDLGSEGWIDRVVADLRVHESDVGSIVEVDSADVWIPGGNVHLTGTMAGSERDFFGFIAINEPTILQRFGIEEVSSLRLEANAELHQGQDGTRLTADATAATTTTSLTVPHAAIEFEWDRPPDQSIDSTGVLRATLEFAEGLAIGSTYFDSAMVRLEGDDALRSGQVNARGVGQEITVSFLGDVGHEGPVWNAQVQQLETMYRGVDLAAVQPFTFVLRPENDIELRGFEMRGSAGVISMEGRISEEAANLVASGDLTLPETVVPVALPRGTWPDHLRFDVSTTDVDSARVLIHATGLTLGDREDLSLYTQARFGAGGATADLLLGTESAVESMLEPEDERGLFEALGLIDAAVDSASAAAGGDAEEARAADGTPAAGNDDGSAASSESEGTADRRGATVGSEAPRDGGSLAQQSQRAREEEIGLSDSRHREWVRIAGDSTLALPDDILARGTAFAPLRVRVSPFQAVMDSGDLRVDLQIEEVPIPTTRADRFLLADGVLTARGTAGSPRGEFRGEIAFRDWEEMEDYHAELFSSFGPDSGLVAQARVLDRDEQVLTADAVVPADLTVYPFAFTPRAGEDASARLDAPSLDLSRFTALLPPRYSMAGDLSIEAQASGAASDPAMTGSIKGRDMEVELADGSRAIGRTDLELSGSALRPRVTGRIDLENGILGIPEQSGES